jgi:alkylation response protein AidB-like acyl-CoA dehydrogenase
MVDLALDDAQEALVASFADLLAKHSSVERVRAAEATLGFDPALWDALREVGAVHMAVPESHGGWGAGVLELALVAEQVGIALAPAPVIEAQVAARLLADCGIAIDDELVTIAVRVVDGDEAPLVPAAAIADAAIVFAGERLVRVPLDDASRRPVANLASAPLADVTVAGGEQIAAAPGAMVAFERAVDEWLVLTSAALVGIAQVAHGLACEYARERHTWGTAIGAYQGVAHPLADDATAIDGARLLARKAACELDRDGSRSRELAAMAFGFASDTAAKVTYDAVHFHGGYGFTLEHDAQLYYRRARGWPRVWGEPDAAYRRAARARLGRAERVG